MTTLTASVELNPGLIVLILVGLVASGKSTFAQALENLFPDFRRCNQDDLGSRRKVEILARQSLQQGLSVCIDRTNFDALQRSHWINIAREFPGTSIWVLVFDTPYETCASRLRERTSHPTIKTAEEGLSVLSRFASDFRHPTPSEGYDRILYLKPSDYPSPAYTREDVSSILHSIRVSPTISTPLTVSPNKADHSHGYRGRAGPSGHWHAPQRTNNWRGVPHHTGNWRTVSPVVRRTGGSMEEHTASSEPSYWRSRMSNIPRSTSVATLNHDQIRVQEKPSQTSDERGTSSASDPMTIT